MAENDIPLGVEVIVTKDKKTKPRMILIGKTSAWFQLVGSKNKKKWKDFRN